MNKLLLTITVTIAFIFSAFAGEPNPIYVKKATFYAEECVKEFKVDDATKAKIIELKTEQIATEASYQAQKRRGDLTESQLKSKNRGLMKKYSAKIQKLVGVKNPRTFQVFDRKVTKEMNKIRS